MQPSQIKATKPCKMYKNCIHIFAVTYFISTLTIAHGETFFMKQGALMEYHPYHSHKEKLQIYCYLGHPKSLLYLWQTVSLEIDSDRDDYVYYEGESPNDVRTKYLDHHSSWRINLFSWKERFFRLDPFKQSCIGIESSSFYRLFMKVTHINYWKVMSLLGGIILFYSAENLSKNVLFYYLCGISFGMCASFLILIYFISKLFPQKPLMYGVAIGGWTIGVYIFQFIWDNLRTIVVNYQVYIMWYALATALISFIFCYRWGPITNERTRNLIRWTLQAGGLISIFASSYLQEAAMAQVIVVFALNNFPSAWLARMKTYWKRRFPPKAKLLNNEEYYQQGVRETSKALDELRQYCSSPDCNQWKTVLKLKDVKRFASFIEGTSHLSDEEMLEYEYSIQGTDVTDDEDEEFTDED